jgi:hypothetical protein
MYILLLMLAAMWTKINVPEVYNRKAEVGLAVGRVTNQSIP